MAAVFSGGAPGCRSMANDQSQRRSSDINDEPPAEAGGGLRRGDS